MLETLANLGEFVGGLAVFATLIYLAYQVSETRKQMRAEAIQQRWTLRINTWLKVLDTTAFHACRDKFFEYELYREDKLLHEIEELELREIRAYRQWLTIELVYFQSLFTQREAGLLSADNSLPLDNFYPMRDAPARREWKDQIRLTGNFPGDYVRYVDSVVKKYDRIEKIMETDENADFNEVMQEVFDMPAPPSWLGNL